MQTVKNKMDEKPGEIPTTVFYTQWNRQSEIPFKSEEPSMTVPNQAMTVQQILERYAQGKPVNANENLLYTEDFFVPQGTTRLEREELERDNQETISELKQKFEEQKQAAGPRKKAERKADKGNDADEGEGGTAEATEDSKKAQD